jgi:protein-tyrosine phosphatase
LREAWRRSESERVEIACRGGLGRTGTALACLAVLDGLPPDDAVAYVRQHYARRAVETPWQRRFVAWFAEA